MWLGSKSPKSGENAVDKKTRQALKSAGYWVGDAEDFLQLTDEERRLVELRLAVSRAVRERLEASNMTQQQLAQKLRSSQSRIAKIEKAVPGVSLDLSFRALFAVGGGIESLGTMPRPGLRKPKQKSMARHA